MPSSSTAVQRIDLPCAAAQNRSAPCFLGSVCSFLHWRTLCRAADKNWSSTDSRVGRLAGVWIEAGACKKLRPVQYCIKRTPWSGVCRRASHYLQGYTGSRPRMACCHQHQPCCRCTLQQQSQTHCNVKQIITGGHWLVSYNNHYIVIATRTWHSWKTCCRQYIWFT